MCVNNRKSIREDRCKNSLTDVNALSLDIVPWSRIRADILTQVTKSNMEWARKVLSGKHLAFRQRVTLLWLEYLVQESVAYESNIKENCSSSYPDLLDTRYMTIGFEMTCVWVHSSLIGLHLLTTPLSPLIQSCYLLHCMPFCKYNMTRFFVTLGPHAQQLLRTFFLVL